MTSTKTPCEVVFTPTFKKNLKALVKRYPSIRTDVMGLIDDLTQGKIVGDQIKGTGYAVFKVRIKNTDVQKGKSSGYRVIYYAASDNNRFLITVYSKSDQGDITNKEIKQFIAECRPC